MGLEKMQSRPEITSEGTRLAKEQEKRLEKMLIVLGDKEVEARTAEALRFTGTSEGVREGKRAIESAGDTTDREHEDQTRELQREVLDESKRSEAELRERSEGVGVDISRMKSAIAEINTPDAKRHMESAERGAEEDRSFLDDSRQGRERNREDGENRRDQQRAQIKGTQIHLPR